MIRRMLEQANRQLIKLEDLKTETETNDEKHREANSRTLARLSNTIERLIRFETERAALRSTKVAGNNAGALEELIRTIDRHAQALGTDEAPEETDG